MSRNGSGAYSLPTGNPVVSGTPITASWANTTLSDIGNELTNSIDKGGRTTPTANLPMGGYKFTGLGAGSAAGESVRFEQVLNQSNSAIAVGATVDLAGATATDIEVTGTGGTVTSFGTGAAVGVRKFVRFSGASNVLTNSATLICQGAANLTMLAGDTCIVTSQGSNIWRVSHVARGAAVTTRLSDIGAAAAANTLANGAYTQTWQWSGLSGGGLGLELNFGSLSNQGTGLLIAGPANGASGFPSEMLRIRGTYGDDLCIFYPSSFYLGGILIQQILQSIAPSKPRELPASTANGADLILLGGDGGASTGVGGDVVAQGATNGATKGVVRLLSGNGQATVTVDGGFSAVCSGAVQLEGSIGLFNLGYLAFDNAKGSSPTISAGGGSGATIRGNSTIFEVTIGTGSPTSVTIAHGSFSTDSVSIPGTSQAGCSLNVTAGSGTIQISSDTALSSGTKIYCITAVMV